MPLPPVTPAIPKQLVKTNVFSTGSSQPPTIASSPQKIQTGGFGDPNGIAAKANTGKQVTIAQLGAFDMPSGSGSGNGLGGSRKACTVSSQAQVSVLEWLPEPKLRMRVERSTRQALEMPNPVHRPRPNLNNPKPRQPPSRDRFETNARLYRRSQKAPHRRRSFVGGCLRKLRQTPGCPRGAWTRSWLG